MSFWTILYLILAVISVSSVAILFVTKRLSKRKNAYIFKTEDGEEIPLGI